MIEILNHFINSGVDLLVLVATDLLMPLMLVGFGVLLVGRVLVTYTVKRQEWFVREFEKRVMNFVDTHKESGALSFYVVSKRLLEKTYYELFEIRGIMKRRRMDYITDPTDRVFLIQHGCAAMVRDTLKEFRFLKKAEGRPQFLEISKSVISNNPAFSKLMGLVSASLVNDILSLIPGFFIVGGIFGTFLGIMKALPELGNMDLTDAESTKLVMDAFLLKIAFSMGTSIVGIVLSVLGSMLNSALSPEKIFLDVVERFDRCLYRLWNRCDDNRIPEQIPNFDEHRDPIEALAEMAIHKELSLNSNSKEFRGGNGGAGGVPLSSGSTGAPLPPPPKASGEK